MRPIRSNERGEERQLHLLLQHWPEIQPTEAQTRRLLRALEVKWAEEQTRYARFHQQDFLFRNGLLLFLLLGSLVVWFWPVPDFRHWWLVAAGVAGIVVVLILPALMRSEPPEGRSHE